MNQPIPITEAGVSLDVVSFEGRIPCGFPSPAQDHTQKRLDLNDVLILNPISTFLFTVEGDSMIGEKIFPGDKLIVDRSVEAVSGRIVLACVDDEFTVKTLYRRGNTIRLIPANPKYQPINFREGQEVSIWGVVTWNLRQVLHKKQ